MAGDQNPGNGDRVEPILAEAPDNDCSCVADVAGRNFLGGEGFGEGDGSVEVVGVGGSEAGDGAAGLGPGGRELGVGVDDSAKLRKFAVKEGVGIEIAGGAKAAFDDFAVEVGDDQVGGSEGGVIDAARLYDDQGLSAAAIDAAGIAEGMRGQAAAGDFLIGFENLLA